MIIGIDIGSTTTKAVAVQNGEVIKTVKTKAFDAVTSATEALGKIVIESNLKISSVDKIIITGAGALKIKDDIFGIPTHKIDEITAIGIGGMFLSKKENIIISNIGTGTSIIEANKNKISHIGGTGIGGGTITGLSKALINISTFDNIQKMAAEGKTIHLKKTNITTKIITINYNITTYQKTLHTAITITIHNIS